jgi:hypothetical protein
MHLVGYLYEDYHDAWSLEHKAIVGSVIFSPCFLLVNPYLKTKLNEMLAHGSGTNLSSGIDSP